MKSSLIAPIIIGALAIPLFIFTFSQRSSHNDSNKSEPTNRPVSYKHVISENANSRDNFIPRSGQKSVRTTVSGLKFGGTKRNGQTSNGNKSNGNKCNGHKSNGHKSNGHSHKKTHKKI